MYALNGDPHFHGGNLTIDKLHFIQIKLFQPKGAKINLISDEGFDDFLNLAEPNSLSKNLNYYGKLHNNGHVSVLNFQVEACPRLRYKR